MRFANAVIDPLSYLPGAYAVYTRAATIPACSYALTNRRLRWTEGGTLTYSNVLYDYPSASSDP